MGTNNTPYCTPENMVDQILGLKNVILQNFPTCEIIISTPTLRTDNTTSNNRNNLFVSHLKKLNIKLILNENIEKKHLNYRGLPLRMLGVIKLSENLVKSIQRRCLEDSCHVSTTKYIGNHSEFVSEIDLLPDLNVGNSKANSTVENGVNEFIEYLQNIRIETSGNLLIGHLNINFIRNKVDMLSYMIGNKIDILMISDLKLDDTFPTSQFVMDGFIEPFRLDRTRNGGGILLYVKNNITATLLTSYTLPEDIEALFVEIVIGNFKWLFCCSYNPHKSMITYHLQEIGKGLEFYTSNYEKILLMGDFNSEMSETSMNLFCNLYNLKCLVQEQTC